MESGKTAEKRRRDGQLWVRRKRTADLENRKRRKDRILLAGEAADERMEEQRPGPGVCVLV